MWNRQLRLLRVSVRRGTPCRRGVQSGGGLRQDVPLTQPYLKEKWVFPSLFSDIVVPEGTFTQYIFDRQEKYCDRTAMVNGETGQSFTNREIRDQSLTFGSALTRLGLSGNDMVALVSPNCPDYAVAFLGISCIGAIPSTINFSYTAEEISFQLQNSGCVAIVCHEDKVPVIREACRNNTNVRHIISMGQEEEGVLSMPKLIKKDDGKGMPSRITVDPNSDLAMLPYSSGTTGLPKGVMLTHRNILANVAQISHPSFNFLETEDLQNTLMGILPMYHIYGSMNFFLTLALGAKIVTLKEFNQYQFVETIKKEKVNILPLVPPLISFLESSSLVSREDLSTVTSVNSGAAPLGQSLVDKFTAKFGGSIQFLEGYGMTETSPVTHSTPQGSYVIGSCGMTIPNTFTKIVDIETGALIGPNQGEGELCVKGPQVMKGYFKNEKATQDTIREDGWLHTGDIARIDEGEHIYVVDRLKELIKVKGMQVAPAELEDLLRKYPGVNDVAVVGIPDERSGELPKAFIVQSESGPRVCEEDLKNFVAKKVAPHKQIQLVSFIDVIPKSAAGKILRKDLRNK